MASFTEDNVAKEMTKILVDEGWMEDDEEIEIGDSHMSSFGVEVYEVGGPYTDVTFTVVEDEDEAVKLAEAVVAQDLEHEPELFESWFIEQYIDEGALKRYVKEAAYDYDYVYELSSDADDFWSTAERYDLEPDEMDEDEDGDDVYPDPSESDIEDLAQAIAEDRAQDPMGWFEDLYGSDARKEAIDAVGIDIEAAAEGAVQAYGWQHFLSRYDGDSYETPSGFVYWREN